MGLARVLGRAFGGLALAILTAIGAGGLVAGDAAAGEAALPVVTVESGPTTTEPDNMECNDGITIYDTASSFVVSRAGDTSAALPVTYSVSGSAQPGVDYAALPGSVTIPAGGPSSTIEVDELYGERTHSVELTLTSYGGGDAAYEVGDPASATITMVIERDPALGSYICGFQLGGALTQTIEVGQGLQPLQAYTSTMITRPVAASHTLTGGALPPDIMLNADGSFSGVARTEGQYNATVEACSTIGQQDCATGNLSVTVTPAGTGILPRTGATRGPLGLAGVLALVLGLLLAGLGRRRYA